MPRVASFVDIEVCLITSFGRLYNGRSGESLRGVEALGSVVGVAGDADVLKDSPLGFDDFLLRSVGLSRASILSIAVFDVWQSSVCCASEPLLSDTEVERDDGREE